MLKIAQKDELEDLHAAALAGGAVEKAAFWRLHENLLSVYGLDGRYHLVCLTCGSIRATASCDSCGPAAVFPAFPVSY